MNVERVQSSGREFVLRETEFGFDVAEKSGDFVREYLGTLDYDATDEVWGYTGPYSRGEILGEFDTRAEALDALVDEVDGGPPSDEFMWNLPY